MITNLGLLLALLTTVLFAAYGLLSRVLSVKSTDPLAFSVVYGLFSAVFSVILLLIQSEKLTAITAPILFVTFLATVGYGVFETLQFFARKYVEASRSTLIFQFAPAATFIASILFLREGLSLQKLLAVILIVGGNLIALYKHGGQISRFGLATTAGSAVALGLAYVGDKVASPHYPFGLYMAISYFFPTLYVFLLFLILRRGDFSPLKREFLSESWRLPFLSLISVSGYYFLLKTLRITQASVAVPIVFSSTLLTVLGGILILKEQSNIEQKLVGAIFVFLGIILLK